MGLGSKELGGAGGGTCNCCPSPSTSAAADLSDGTRSFAVVAASPLC